MDSNNNRNNMFTNKIQNNPVLLEPIVLEDFGGVADTVKTADWTPYLSKPERQRKLFDGWTCVNFSSNNCIEVEMNYLIAEGKLSLDDLQWLNNKGYLVDGKFEISERYDAILSGTIIDKGNSGRNVAMTKSIVGVIPEFMLPFTDDMTAEQYFNSDSVTREMRDLGEEFLERFPIAFKAVWEADFEEELKQSPIQVFVYGWAREGGIYINPDGIWNHAVMMIKKHTISDSYEPFIKTLEDNYDYYVTGYRYIINYKSMKKEAEQFILDNDLKWIRNAKTGAFGRIIQGELKMIGTDERGVLMLLDARVRENGVNISPELWDSLNKSNF